MSQKRSSNYRIRVYMFIAVALLATMLEIKWWKQLVYPYFFFLIFSTIGILLGWGLIYFIKNKTLALVVLRFRFGIILPFVLFINVLASFINRMGFDENSLIGEAKLIVSDNKSSSAQVLINGDFYPVEIDDNEFNKKTISVIYFEGNLGFELLKLAPPNEQ